MDRSDLFKSIHQQFLEKDLIPVTRHNWGMICLENNITTPIDIVTKWLSDRGLSIEKLFYIPSYFFRFWYIDEFSFISIPDLSNETTLDIFAVSKRVQQTNEQIREFLSEGNFEHIFIITETPFLVNQFYKLYPLIPVNEKINLFISIYTRIDYGFEYFSKELLTEIFTSSPSDKYKLPEHLAQQEYIQIFRGQTSQSSDYSSAYSWTLDSEIAAFFANRFDSEGVIYTAKVKPCDVLAYITNRNEEEILVLPEKVYDIQEVD